MLPSWAKTDIAISSYWSFVQSQIWYVFVLILCFCAQISMSVAQHPVRMVAHVPTLWAPTRVSVCLALMDMTVIMVGEPCQKLAFLHFHWSQGFHIF